MTKIQAAFVATAETMLAGSGAELSIVYGGKHPKIIIAMKDRVIKQPFPCSPSDRRSLLHWKSQLRRRLVQLGVENVA